MKIICVGQNYPSHNKEMNREPCAGESAPVLFIKPDSAILHDDKNRFFIPDFSSDIQYETELVVKINKMGKNIAERFASRYYEEITLGIDFTARDLQAELKKNSLPWEISKAFDNSAALGLFVPKSKFSKNIDNLNFSLTMNGQTVQSANTSEMIHHVDSIIAYASRFFTLKTGDLVFTGTPAGVGRVSVNDHLQGFIESEQLLDIHIC